jgi:hypothetical protein
MYCPYISLKFVRRMNKGLFARIVVSRMWRKPSTVSSLDACFLHFITLEPKLKCNLGSKVLKILLSEICTFI